jgi:hypothetical protein
MLLDRTDDEDGMTLPSPTTRKYSVLVERSLYSTAE